MKVLNSVRRHHLYPEGDEFNIYTHATHPCWKSLKRLKST